MAVKGDILDSPENGFKRYHCSDTRFACKGTWVRKNAEEKHDENSCYSTSSDCSIEFKFYGSKLILFSSMFPTACIDCKVIIDGEEDIFSPYSENYSGNTNTVVYVSKTLNKASHIVKLLPGTDKADKLILNAIDIDEDGYLITSIGDQLKQPEEGWKRIDNTDTRIVYSKGSSWNDRYLSGRYNDTLIFISEGVKEGYFTFYFYGNKLRIVQSAGTDYATDTQVVIDGKKCGFLQTRAEPVKHERCALCILVYENIELKNTAHKVVVECGTNGLYGLECDCLDINEDGRFLTEEEYESMLNRTLIKFDNKYYTIENDNLVEITNEITSQLIIDRGVTLYTLTEKQSLLPDKFKLISYRDNTFNIRATKSHKELVVTSSDFLTTVQSNIDFFDAVGTTDSGTSIKVTFSIDGGATWKTYDTEFRDLSVTIPLKPYNELTEEELNQWNNARDVISEQGIDVANLSKIDFNSLSMDKIRFAYVFNIENANNNCKLNSTKMTYDEKPPYRLMKDNEVDIDINEIDKKIIITPHITTPEIKVNISSNGILSNDTVIDNLTEDQINKLKIKLGL